MYRHMYMSIKMLALYHVIIICTSTIGKWLSCKRSIICCWNFLLNVLYKLNCNVDARISKIVKLPGSEFYLTVANKWLTLRKVRLSSSVLYVFVIKGSLTLIVLFSHLQSSTFYQKHVNSLQIKIEKHSHVI